MSYKKGQIGYWRGKKRLPMLEEHRKKISRALKGKMPKNWHPEIGFKKGNSIWKGRKHTEEAKKKISQSHKGKPSYIKGKTYKEVGRVPKLIGEKNPAWKGGITPINEKIRRSPEYILWRKAVFERDNYICVWCKATKVFLEADHIKPFALYPELRFAIDNGRTLCRECHKKTETYGRRFQYR